MSRRVGFIHPTAIIGEPAESRDATQDAGWYIHEDATIEALASVDSGTITTTRIDADAWIFKHALSLIDIEDLDADQRERLADGCHVWGELLTEAGLLWWDARNQLRDEQAAA